MSGALRIEHLAPGAARPAKVDALAPPVDPAAHSAPPSLATELLVGWRADRPVARCSVALAHELHGAPGASGLVGHYEALDAAAGVALLARAAAILTARGAARVLGPMDGDTWHRYRLALRSRPDDPVQDPPFFLGEPRNPLDYPDHFEAAGFTPAAYYETRIDRGVASATPAGPFPSRLAEHGLHLRNLEVARFDDELRALHSLSVVAFARNPYYVPIDLPGFLALYRSLAPLVDPRFVLMVEHPDRGLVGFLFAYPDRPGREAAGPRWLIAKTIATDPALQGLGLMGYLFDRMRDDARAAGFEAVLHALMEQSNVSERLSRRHGGVLYRRYALYGRAS